MRSQFRDQAQNLLEHLPASYVPPFQLGEPLQGGAIGEVIASNDSRLKPGDLVSTMFGWRGSFNAPASNLQKLDTFGLRRRYYKQIALEKRRAGVRWLKARRGGADDGIRVMNEVDQADAEDLASDVSDEVLETAAKNEALPAWTWVCSGISCPG